MTSAQSKKTDLFAKMHLAHRKLCSTSTQVEQVKMMGDPAKATSLKVFARQDLPVGSLLLFPLVPSAQSIMATSNHPDRVPTASCDLHGRTLDIVPCVRLPKADKHNKDQPNCGGHSTWVAPLWHIRRNKDRSKCNCVMAALCVTSISTIGAVSAVCGNGEAPVCTKE